MKNEQTLMCTFYLSEKTLLDSTRQETTFGKTKKPKKREKVNVKINPF